MGSRAELSLASKGLRPERNAGWLASAGSWCPAGLAMENGEARGLGREHLQVVLALGSLVAPASAVCGDWRREGVSGRSRGLAERIKKPESEAREPISRLP